MSAVARDLASPAPGTAIACRSVARSHVGLVRMINEDRVLDDVAAGLWAVADGMGGHAGGDLAAQAVVDVLRRAGSDGLADALQQANAVVHERNQRLGLDAGATAVAARLAGERLEIAWAGDSRAYRIGDGIAEQLTHDHSVVQQLLDAGVITAELAATHPHVNVVTRALGVDPTVAVDRTDVPARGGRFLLCSDGLSRSLSMADLSCDRPLETLADALIAAALARDGTDNVSLVLIDVA